MFTDQERYEQWRHAHGFDRYAAQSHRDLEMQLDSNGRGTTFALVVDSPPHVSRTLCHDCKRCRRPVARTARRSIAARTDASDPTTRTLAFARVTAV